jgi:hypothetical protein
MKALAQVEESEENLKLLLTSGGVTNPSIHSALVGLLGKPVEECRALCVPTAQWGHPMCGPASVRGFIAAEPDWQYLSRLGWASDVVSGGSYFKHARSGTRPADQDGRVRFELWLGNKKTPRAGEIARGV